MRLGACTSPSLQGVIPTLSWCGVLCASCGFSFTTVHQQINTIGVRSRGIRKDMERERRLFTASGFRSGEFLYQPSVVPCRARLQHSRAISHSSCAWITKIETLEFVAATFTSDLADAFRCGSINKPRNAK
jgi:hypothetical protein